MLKFRDFLIEVNISASGNNAARHFNQYIAPYLAGGPLHDKEETTHEVGSKVKGFNPGDRVNITGHEIIRDKHGNDVHHVTIKGENGQTAKVRASVLKKPNITTSPHSDEHAVKNVWNHFLDHDKNKMSDEKGMIDEINRAASDPNHPLSFEKAHTDGFVGKVKKEEYRTQYYSELRNAARTISDMSSHSDFKKSIEQGHRAEVTGTHRPDLSSTYKEAGVKGTGAITKVDLKIGPNNISLKKGDKLPTKITRANEITGAVKPRFTKGKGEGRDMVMRIDGRPGTAQLASSGPADMKGIHYHALTKLKLSPEQMSAAKQKIDNIADIMSMKDNNHKERANKIKNIYSSLINDHPELGHHVFREAVTGEGKHPDFHATHIVTSRREE